MVNAIRNRFNWQSRKTRALVAAAVCAAGLGIGFGGSMILGSETPPPPTYCLYSISAPPPGCNAFQQCPPTGGVWIYDTVCTGTCPSAVQVCGESVDLYGGSGCYSSKCP